MDEIAILHQLSKDARQCVVRHDFQRGIRVRRNQVSHEQTAAAWSNESREKSKMAGPDGLNCMQELRMGFSERQHDSAKKLAQQASGSDDVEWSGEHRKNRSWGGTDAGLDCLGGDRRAWRPRCDLAQTAGDVNAAASMNVRRVEQPLPTSSVRQSFAVEIDQVNSWYASRRLPRVIVTCGSEWSRRAGERGSDTGRMPLGWHFRHAARTCRGPSFSCRSSKRCVAADLLAVQ
jgi:hypothetical protein